MAAELSGGFMSLAAIVTTILSSYNCQTVSSIGETSVIKNEWIRTEDARRRGAILATIVDRIVELYEPESKLLCILTAEEIENNSIAEAFENLLKLETRDVITFMPGARDHQTRYDIYQKPTTYVLLGSIDSSSAAEALINFGKIGATWNPRGLFIGVAESKEEAAKQMRNLSKNYVYKVVVLVLDRNNGTDTVEAYTWRPYYPRNYCGPPTVENIVRLGTFAKSLQFEKETDIELGKVPKTFGNCPLKVDLTIWEPFVFSPKKNKRPGFDERLVRMLCEKIELRIVPKYYTTLSAKREGEVRVGTVVPISSYLVTHDVMLPYMQDSFIWLVPCYVDTNSLELANKLSYELLALTVVAMSLAAISLIRSGQKHWMLWVWGSLWEQSDNKIPKKVRSIWGCWLFLCLHLSVVYRTLLVSQLTNDPPIRGEVESQSELLESKLKFGFVVQAEPWFDKEDEVEKRILARYVPCETVQSCYDEIPTGRAVFTNKMLGDYLNVKKNRSIAEKVCQLPTSLTYKITILYVKGHAAAPGFNRLLHYTVEGGLIEYWMKRIERIQTKTKMLRMNLRRERKITLEHVYGGFKVLATGLTVAGVSLLCEIFRDLSMKILSTNAKGRRIFWKVKTEI